ncbi:MAG: DUF3179 domain-containing protein [Anaerolineaceae bacterium]|nr:DUF3179 domain-containing protein [Anaerolineaceae bacterium]
MKTHRIPLMRAALIVLALAPGWVAALAQDNAGVDVTDHERVIQTMVGQVADYWTTRNDDAGLIEAVGASDDPLYIAPLIDMAYFLRGTDSRLEEAVYTALAQLSGQDFRADWTAWFTWSSAQNPALPPGYGAFKGALFSTLLDPAFARFFPPDVLETARVNLHEAVWGGVRVDGIPALVNATQITPQEANAEGEAFTQFCREGDCRYPAPDEYVFGVSINGDNRAYPLRLLNWHELFNDVIGHAPLYDEPDGEIVCHYRAPGPFRAVARQGDSWVQISGDSAGCPVNGWLGAPETLVWTDSGGWDAVRAALPDSGETPLTYSRGLHGSVPGKAVALAYCTLCGSGILYDTTIPDLVVDGEHQGETVLEFGSTGMLMRSNKLMYDRNTDTVWNAITGEPAFGPLAGSGIRLTILPVVVTDWAAWLAEHPDTSVLSLQTGYNRPYINGQAYHDYFNDPDFIMFPVWQQDTHENANKEVVFTLNLNDTPKAYPLRYLVAEGVTNDTLAGIDVVIVTRETPGRSFFEPGGAAVRAYQRGGHTFQPGETSHEVIEQDGAVWIVTEDALISPDGETLARLGGHLAFWFGWYGFYPDTLVYEGES